MKKSLYKKHTNMKKLILSAAAMLLLAVAPAQAQDWLDALKKVATTAVDNATDGKLTEYALVGTWSYTGPGVKFESDDVVSSLGGAAVESTVSGKLEQAYLLAGIKPGACSFTFEKENTFTACFGTKELSGTYEFDASTHVITLDFAKGKYNLGAIPGHAYVSGTELQLVFPVTKLVNMVTALGSKISSLSTVTTLLQKYENVYIGFEFGK